MTAIACTYLGLCVGFCFGFFAAALFGAAKALNANVAKEDRP